MLNHLLAQRSSPPAAWAMVLETEGAPGWGQERQQGVGQMQEREAERWNGMGVEVEFWSVRVSALLQDASCNCASGWHSGFYQKGSAGAGRSGGVTCSLTENYGSSGSFCSADTGGMLSGCAGLPFLQWDDHHTSAPALLSARCDESNFKYHTCLKTHKRTTGRAHSCQGKGPPLHI